MAIEKKWRTIPPRAFRSDGTQFGQIELSTTDEFKVKHKVRIIADTLPPLTLQVKRVLSKNLLIVGPPDGNIKATTDITAYTVALNAVISANEQPKSAVPPLESWGAVFEREPTVAVRTIQVDEFGDIEDRKKTTPDFTAFGGLHVANLKPIVNVSFNYTNHPDQIDTVLVGSGTVTNVGGLAEIRSGAAINSSARLFTKDALEFAAGQGILARWVAFFDAGVAGNNQKVGAGDNTDGLFVGFSGTIFGTFLILAGVPLFIPQNRFSEDVLNGTGPSGLTIDPTKGNIYQIQSTGSGIGHTVLSVMDPVTRRFIPFHVINAINVATGLNARTIVFPISAISENSTNTTDVVIRLGNLAGLIEGRGELSTIRRSVAVVRTAITAETAVITIRNKDTFVGRPNFVRIQMDYMSTANDGAKPVTYRLVRDTTLGGVPVFADIDTTGSVIEFDSAGTTLTGGTEILTWELAKDGSETIVTTSLFIVLRPGEQMTISATSAVATEVNVAIGWRELF